MDSRMVESLFPLEGMVVMGRIREINLLHNTALLDLVEYNNMEGLVYLNEPLETAPWRIEPVIVGRIEPVLVQYVNADTGRLRAHVSRNVSLASYHDCEWTYARRTFVHSVLSLVALRTGRQLNEIYTFLDWPTYESIGDETILEVARAYGVPQNVRNELMETLDLLSLFTYRIERPYLLSPTKRFQSGWCWAAALIKQMEAFLKSQNRLEPDIFLSVQDLINHTPRRLMAAEGDVNGLEAASNGLCVSGIVADEICPLGGQRVAEPCFICPISGEVVVVPHTTYRIGRLRIVYDGGRANWDKKIEDLLQPGGIPVAATVIWWPSYAENHHGTELYRPNSDERKRYARNPYSKENDTHTMLLTSKGVNENGVPFLEFQDNTSDVNNGDRGFLRFARYDPCPVIEFALMSI